MPDRLSPTWQIIEEQRALRAIAEADHAAPEITREQWWQLRESALNTAAYIIGDVSGTPHGLANHVIDLAEPLLEWLRTGRRPYRRSGTTTEGESR
jgi:hypothetical protein